MISLSGRMGYNDFNFLLKINNYITILGLDKKTCSC